MTKPITPLVGADIFTVNQEDHVCLIQRKDNGLWALPGGCQNLGETPKHCAEREFLEETGLQAEVTHLLGVFSSSLYEYVHYPCNHISNNRECKRNGPYCENTTR